MGLVSSDDGWRMPDWLWELVEPLLPSRPAHPLGCHRPRVSDRAAMDAILLVLRTGMQWNALNAPGVCTGRNRAALAAGSRGTHPACSHS
jgi:transposase